MTSIRGTSIRRRGFTPLGATAVLAALALGVSAPTDVGADPPTPDETLSPTGLLGLEATAGNPARVRAMGAPGNGATIRAPGFLFVNGRYTTIEAPRARTHTYAHGINNRGRIAGGFDNPSVDGPVGRIHGSIRRKNGRFVRFDVPGAIGTLANKINDRGQVVGGYNDTNPSVGAPGTKGFLDYRGELKTINVPGSIETQAVGLNNDGVVVGEYVDSDGIFHGFRWHRGRFTTIDGPGSLGGAVFDINDRGQMVGAYLADDGAYLGFLLDKGVYTTIEAPGTPDFTLPSDINNRGQIVGSALSGVAESDGFFLRKGVDGPFTRIDFPGALGTIPRGIDDRGRIVGLYDRNPLSVKPKRRIVKQGESATFTATIEVPGGVDVSRAKVCVRAPSRAIEAARCVNLGRLPAGDTKVKFEAKAKRNTEPRSYKLRFKASASGVDPVMARATLRVKEGPRLSG